MDHKDHDKVFIVNFGVVLAALVGITVVCVATARLIDTGETHADPDAAKRVEERVRPVGVVVTDPAALVQVAVAAKPARAAYTGEQVVQRVCGACHNTGLMGAPKAGDAAAWTARGNLEHLTVDAIKGQGAMPPRGGDPDLTDAEIRAAIEVMMKGG